MSYKVVAFRSISGLNQFLDQQADEVPVAMCVGHVANSLCVLLQGPPLAYTQVGQLAALMTDTTDTVLLVSTLYPVAVGDTLKIDTELMTVVALKPNDELTVTRGDPAEVHAEGGMVYVRGFQVTASGSKPARGAK